jgi:hypothetical protein
MNVTQTGGSPAAGGLEDIEEGIAHRGEFCFLFGHGFLA